MTQDQGKALFAGFFSPVIQVGVEHAEHLSACFLHQHRVCAAAGAGALAGVAASGYRRGFGQPEGVHFQQLVIILPEHDRHLLAVQLFTAAAADRVIIRKALFQPCGHMRFHFLETDDVRFFPADDLHDQGLAVNKTVFSVLRAVNAQIERDEFHVYFLPSREHFCDQETNFRKSSGKARGNLVR